MFQGGEFTSTRVKEFLGKKNANIFCLLHQRLAILDRAVRTLRSISTNIQNLTQKNEKNAFLDSIQIFNKTPKKSLRLKSPNDVVADGFICSPWQILSNNKIRHFDYNKNKVEIDKKMKLVKKQFKILAPVRISTQRIKRKIKIDMFKKKSTVEGWTSEVYFVYGYKSKCIFWTEH